MIARDTAAIELDAGKSPSAAKATIMERLNFNISHILCNSDCTCVNTSPALDTSQMKQAAHRLGPNHIRKTIEYNEKMFFFHRHSVNDAVIMTHDAAVGKKNDNVRKTFDKAFVDLLGL